MFLEELTEFREIQDGQQIALIGGILTDPYGTSPLTKAIMVARFACTV